MELFGFRALRIAQFAPPIRLDKVKFCFAAIARLGRSLYQRELALLQFIHRAWTDARRRGRLWSVFGQCGLLSIYCPFRPENWFDSVERVEAGETMDSKNGQ
jgi:hypothetical protein